MTTTTTRRDSRSWMWCIVPIFIGLMMRGGPINGGVDQSCMGNNDTAMNNRGGCPGGGSPCCCRDGCSGVDDVVDVWMMQRVRFPFPLPLLL
mmetsp:Transcript_34044/g.38046  ORF Transcript_34044/g.38046 Transcript_34044/m.38046 type:complete len:92 (-) Transcript_34044:780-1055(-)